MIYREKLIKAFECHQIQENGKAYNCAGCPYIWTDDCTEQMAKETAELLKEQDKVINTFMEINLKLNQHIKDLSEYMTPYGRVADVKAYDELVKEKDDLGTELTNAMELIHKKNERIKKLEEQIETLTKWRMNAGAFD